MLVPVWCAVDADRFEGLAASGDPAADAVGLVGADGVVSVDVDKAWLGVTAALSSSAAVAAVEGDREWSEDPRVVVSSPAEVSGVAEALAGVEVTAVAKAGAAEVKGWGMPVSASVIASAVGRLAEFYAAAAGRGDGVVIVFQ